MGPLKTLGTAILLFAASTVAAHANLIIDNGFENCANVGDAPPGWSATGATCSSGSHSGNWAAELLDGHLIQSVSLTPGDTYDFSFWLSGQPNQASGLNVFFGINLLLATTSTGSPYTEEDFQVVAYANSETAAFVVPAHGSWLIDDVSVTDSSTPVSVPEPLSLLTFGAGLAGAVAMRRRKTKTA